MLDGREVYTMIPYLCDNNSLENNFKRGQFNRSNLIGASGYEVKPLYTTSIDTNATARIV